MKTRIHVMLKVAIMFAGILFSGGGTISAETQAYGKLPPNGNPLITQKFGADPYVITFNGRVYMYLTNDILEYDANGQVISNSYSKINKITVISSDDMVNWTDHGEIAVAGSQGAAKWANNSWAPAVASKVINGKTKFFLYFANNASSIGVLTSDSPIGPWTDPIGKSLIDRSVPGAESVTWLFDPAVLVDDDGSAYLYFGGGVPTGQDAHPQTSRVIRLGSDMVSVSGRAETIDAPYMFEDSGINKVNGLYYYSYCSNFSGGTRPAGSPAAGEIAYMVSSSPMGPFTYVKTILKNPSYYFGVGGNNHHAMFQFNGQWYIAYHAQTLAKDMGVAQGYRSPHLNKVTFSSNGEIQLVNADLKGVAQLKNLNPYSRVEAETMAWNGGIVTEKSSQSGGISGSSNLSAAYINDGDWIAVSSVDFGAKGAAAFSASVSSGTSGGSIELHLDSVAGTKIGTLPVASTGGWSNWRTLTTSLNQVTGVHTLYLVFKGNTSSYLMNMDSWIFTQRAAMSMKASANNTYVTAENAGSSPLIANRSSVGSWEQFAVIENPDGTISLLSLANNKFVTVDQNQGNKLIASAVGIDTGEKFNRIANSDGTISLRAVINNQFVCADLNTTMPELVANRASAGAWEKFSLSAVQ